MGNKENRSQNQPASTRTGQVATGYSIRGKHWKIFIKISTK